MSDGTDSRILTERARSALAERARLPWWFVGAQALGMLSLLGAPVLSRVIPWVWAYPVLLWVGVLMILAGQPILWRLQGASFSRKTLRAYPSTRRAGLAFLAAFLVAAVAEVLLFRSGVFWAAGALVVVAAVGWAGFLVQQNTAMRRDIRDGRVVVP